MSTDTPRPEREDLSPETRAALERGLAQSAAGETVDLGTFSRPERKHQHPCPTHGCPGDGHYAPPGKGHRMDCDWRVTLTDGERDDLVSKVQAYAYAEGLTGRGAIQAAVRFGYERATADLAAREQALREEIGEPHAYGVEVLVNAGASSAYWRLAHALRWDGGFKCECGGWSALTMAGHSEHVADALLASPAIADLIREKQAEAWEDGIRYGASVMDRNPYRADQVEGGA